MAKGGKQPGAGRPKGAKNKTTLEKQAVQDAFNQRVMNAADKLFDAQIMLALGSMKVFRIDKTEVDGKTKRIHVHVTDAAEIKTLLDEHDGNAGEVDGTFYYFQTVAPDNKAIDSMLNRALGKPKETHEISGKDGQPIQTESTNKYDLSNLSKEELFALKAIQEKLNAV